VNRITNLKDSANLSFLHSYDAVNRLTARGAPNGVTTNYAYDGLDRLTTLNHVRGASTLVANQYAYNDANNIASWTNAAGSHNYGYDVVDRLTSATNSAQLNESYSYDAVGNRTTSHLSASYNYQPFNRLASTSTGTSTYDNNGNLTSRTDSLGTTIFTWNEENQLTQVALPGGLMVSYKYDGLGRRIQRTTSAGANERYVYDGPDVLLDLNADWSVATKYLNGPGIDNHLRQTSASTGVSHYLTDHLGSTAALTDATGNVVEQESYDSFGNGAGSVRTRYGYTGRERDPDTGLLYYRARWYDPQVGRFISEDPIGLAGGINSYGYVGNGSISRKDPSGLSDIDVHYYLTYYIARATGCFTDAGARLIAEGNQQSDEDEMKKPGWGNTVVFVGGSPSIVPDRAQRARNVAFHAFGTHEQNAKRAAELLSQANRNGGNLFLFGTYLHFLQDSFTHFDFAGNHTWGQFSAGNTVDHTSFDPKKAMKLARATFEALRAFGRRNGCDCNGEPDWKLVQDFIDVGYDQSTTGGSFGEVFRGVSDEQLRRKIGLLEVPWRSSTGR
jgi:RHS repeat-associated protein